MKTWSQRRAYWRWSLALSSQVVLVALLTRLISTCRVEQRDNHWKVSRVFSFSNTPDKKNFFCFPPPPSSTICFCLRPFHRHSDSDSDTDIIVLMDQPLRVKQSLDGLIIVSSIKVSLVAQCLCWGLFFVLLFATSPSVWGLTEEDESVKGGRGVGGEER